MTDKIKSQMTEWLIARCPICGRGYEYTVTYKPPTCSSFECVQKYLHPELHEPYFKKLIEGGDNSKQ